MHLSNCCGWLSLYAGFALYCAEARPILCKENPEFTKKEIALALGSNWKYCLKEDERVSYLKRSRLLRELKAAEAPVAAPAVAPGAADAPAVAPRAAATPAAGPPAAATPAAMRIVPINQLNPHENCWTIKVRVSSKREIRHWQNDRGEGKVFSFDCIDEVSKALYVLFWGSHRKTTRVGSERCMLLTPAYSISEQRSCIEVCTGWYNVCTCPCEEVDVVLVTNHSTRVRSALPPSTKLRSSSFLWSRLVVCTSSLKDNSS